LRRERRMFLLWRRKELRYADNGFRPSHQFYP
jgi:hypothetical protein